MQDSKKNEKVVQKPGRFKPQEVKVEPLDDITAQIESLVTKSQSDRMRERMYMPSYMLEQRPECSINCPCVPCRRGDCSHCNIGMFGYDPTMPYRF